MEKETNGASLQAVIGKFEDLFDRFNNHLFNGELERPVIAVSPDTTKVGAWGWFTSWRAWQGEKEGGYYEINMCAEHLARPFEDLCGTLLHEMVHLKNKQDGVEDTSRSGTYHNKSFKIVAEEHGLIVKKSEKYGFSKTELTEEIIEWLKVQYSGDTSFTLKRIKETNESETGKKSSTRKYVCPACKTIIRASKIVNVVCGDCNITFMEVVKSS